jgi:hypothetical protein
LLFLLKFEGFGSQFLTFNLRSFPVAAARVRRRSPDRLSGMSAIRPCHQQGITATDASRHDAGTRQTLIAKVGTA